MGRSAFAAAVLLLAAGSACADGIHLNGVSPRSIGRGGTNLAFSDNGGILFDNPAGAVNISSEGLFELAGAGLITDMRYADPDNPSVHDVNLVPIPQLAYIQRHSTYENLAWGFGIFTPAGFMQSWKMTGPDGREQPYNSWGSLTKFLPCVAYQVNDQLSIGGSFGFAVSHVELEGPYTLQNAGLLTGLPTFVNLHATGVAPIFSVGLQYELTEATTIGAAYQSESRFSMSGKTDVALPLVGDYPFDLGMNITWPRTLGLGVRHQLDPQRVFSVDVIWFDWSSAFDDFGITLTDAAHPNLPSIGEKTPLNWRDSVSVRLGYERQFFGNQTARAGYVYHRNPIPAQTLTPYIPAILEHCFSVGYGVQWGLWEIDAAYMFTFSPEVYVPASGIIGGDFDGSTYKAFTHFIGASLIRRF
jgi:long-chain fatty acid transport protein